MNISEDYTYNKYKDGMNNSPPFIGLDPGIK